MRIITLLVCLFLHTTSCSSAFSPKETVIQFIVALKKLDFETASALANDETKNWLLMIKMQYQSSSLFKEKIIKAKQYNRENIVKKYSLNNLVEIIEGKNAIVQLKGRSQEMVLEKDKGIWKVVCKFNLIDHIINEEKYLSFVNRAYDELMNEYKERQDLVKRNILVLQLPGINSIKAKSIEIEQIEKNISNIKEYDKKQTELYELLSGLQGLKPEQTDILEEAINYIKIARAEYNSAVSDYEVGYGPPFPHLTPMPIKTKAPDVRFD